MQRVLAAWQEPKISTDRQPKTQTGNTIQNTTASKTTEPQLHPDAQKIAKVKILATFLLGVYFF